MKKIIIALAVLFPFSGIAQKVFDIGGISIKSNTAMIGGSIAKVKGSITVDDSTFNTNVGNQSQTFRIIKKVNDKYFKVNDGIEDYVVRITEQKMSKYSGAINIESPNVTMIYFIKD